MNAKTMQEYITHAVVLDVRRRGEQDKEISFLSENLGKFKAVLISGSKITSRFSPQCDVFDYVMIRGVHKNRHTVTDIITEKKYARNFSSIHMRRAFLLAHFLDKNLPDEVPDNELWRRFVRDCERGALSFSEYLSHLGYGGVHAACARCASHNLSAFSFKEQEFLCKSCSSNIPENELLLI